MTAINNITSRRGILGALAVAPIAGAIPAASQADAATDTEQDFGPSPYAEGYNDAHDDTLATMAAAWVDRWTALGGDFSMSYNADGAERGMVRGIPMSYVWTEPSWQDASAHSAKLRPHEVITRREDFNGAQKMLESFLTLVPGLERAVRDHVRPIIGAGAAQRAEAIASFLEERRA